MKNIQKRSIDELPFDEVMMAFNRYLIAKEQNNLYERTRLLREYPDFFDQETEKEVTEIYKMREAIVKRQSAQGKIIHFPAETPEET